MKPRQNLLDIDQLIALGDLMGCEVYQIIEGFASSLMDRVADLRGFSEERNTGEMRMAIHEIWEGALSCGFLSVASMLDQGRLGDSIDFSGLEVCARESIGKWKLFLSAIRF